MPNISPANFEPQRERRAFLRASLALAVSGLPLASAAATKSEPGVHVMLIDGMTFATPPSGIRGGDIIEWVNRDLFQHTATARDGRFDVLLAPGAKARTVATAGTVDFYCKFHPGMTGTLVVK